MLFPLLQVLFASSGFMSEPSDTWLPGDRLVINAPSNPHYHGQHAVLVSVHVQDGNPAGREYHALVTLLCSTHHPPTEELYFEIYPDNTIKNLSLEARQA